MGNVTSSIAPSKVNEDQLEGVEMDANDHNIQLPPRCLSQTTLSIQTPFLSFQIWFSSRVLSHSMALITSSF